MRLLLRSSAGLMLWAASFATLYALQGMSCALGWNHIPMPVGTLAGWVLVTAWSVFGAGAVLAIRWARQLPSGMERRLAIASATIGFVAILVTGVPVLFTSTCLY